MERLENPTEVIFGYTNLRSRLEAFLRPVQDVIEDADFGNFHCYLFNFEPFDRIL